jgi:glycosyltransferase involved in cell wall biosynthesis
MVAGNKPVIKPKIIMLILEYHPVFTGHGIYLEKLINKLQKLNCEVSILAADFQEFLPFENINGIKVYRFSFSHNERYWELKLAIRVILFLIRHRSDYDILHINGHLDIYGFLTLFNKFTLKHTVTQMVLLGADDPMTLKKTYKGMSLRLKILSGMDQFLCISRVLMDSCLQARLPLNKLTYIPQGVDVDRFTPVKSPEERVLIRSALGLPLGVDIVMFVGAIVERKGVDWLVDAWQKVQKVNSEACLILVGQNKFDNRDINQIQLNAFVSGIADVIYQNGLNIVMVGGQSNVEAYLKCADVFVLPSRKEGFGNVILEAMSCGLPAIVTYMDGVSKETVTHGENGYIAHGVDDIGKYILKLLVDKNLAKKLGQDGRKKALEKFSLDQIAERYLAVYQNIVSKKMCKTIW